MVEFNPYHIFWTIIGISIVYIFRTRLLRLLQTRDLLLLSSPPYSSLLAGNSYDFVQDEIAGDLDRKWIKEHGLAFKIRGTIWEPKVLYLADPLGVQYVLETRGYGFHKDESAKIGRLLTGRNLLGTEGPAHANQRKILLPGFSQSVLKELVPLFIQLSDRLASKWNDLLLTQTSITVDVRSWLSRLTLDAIGQGK
ncbi:hypothetical protein M422DRAFT_38359 [Sphaerobolus stellatus SS14]|uniref:Cytochrome P450 n=1 Tax=Sphaerobolus stellatus (strain SS14) TaxID=990650 RepID=A0A0C9TW99_SPHS4|nr:hypothetical protein M422DRAFT_38359 [Sphaerobolus stellatus SS14]